MLSEWNRLPLKFAAEAAEVADYVDRCLRLGTCLGAQRVAGFERDGARKLLSPPFKCICYPGQKQPALARNRARPGGKGFGRGFHRAHDIFGATPRHLRDRAPVRWIFNFEPLTRSAVDPFAANQHAFLLKRGPASAYFGDSRHCHLLRFFCGCDPASGATTLNTTSCSRARSIDRV